MAHSFTGLVNCLEALLIRALNKIHNALDEGRCSSGTGLECSGVATEHDLQ
jgi:hypothetical protein